MNIVKFGALVGHYNIAVTYISYVLVILLGNSICSSRVGQMLRFGEVCMSNIDVLGYLDGGLVRLRLSNRMVCRTLHSQEGSSGQLLAGIHALQNTQKLTQKVHTIKHNKLGIFTISVTPKSGEPFEDQHLQLIKFVILQNTSFAVITAVEH